MRVPRSPLALVPSADDENVVTQRVLAALPVITIDAKGVVGSSTIGQPRFVGLPTIVALDAGDWPPAGAPAPNELARAYGQRDAAMEQRILSILQRDPRTRMLLFLDGVHALRSGGANVQTGGTRTVEVQWLAARLSTAYPQDVYSILVDASAPALGRPRVAAYRGTAAGPLLAPEFGRREIAAPVRSSMSFTRQPIRVSATPGINFELAPRTFAITDVAKAQIYLGQ